MCCGEDYFPGGGLSMDMAPGRPVMREDLKATCRLAHMISRLEYDLEDPPALESTNAEGAARNRGGNLR